MRSSPAGPDPRIGATDGHGAQSRASRRLVCELLPNQYSVRVTGRFKQALPQARVMRSRDEALLSLCKGRRVLHVGCADAPFTQEKLQAGTLLHRSLLESAADVVGIDIDAGAVSILEKSIGGKYHIIDISSGADLAEVVTGPQDVVLATDVVEHVSDEFSFMMGLRRLANLAQNPRCRIVISTPNALMLRNSVYTLFNAEVIHPDHRRIHSPYTLAYSMAQCGFEISERIFYSVKTGDTLPRRATDAFFGGVARLRPAFADGMIYVGRMSANSVEG